MSLNILILGAGYGTRLQRDIVELLNSRQTDDNDDKNNSNDNNNSINVKKRYQKLLGVPKALLPLGGKDALIDHWLEIFKRSNIDISKNVYLVTNDKSYQDFVGWAERNGIPSLNIVNDGTTNNDNRLGAVGDIELAIKHFKLNNSNLLVIGGDTLFLRDFDFDKIYKRFISSNNDGCLVTAYAVDDESTKKFGIITLENCQYKNEDSKEEEKEEEKEKFVVTKFLEKPGPTLTTSRYACPCFYFLKQGSLHLIADFLKFVDNDPGSTLNDKDATGKLLAWIINNKKFKIYAEKIEGRIDVGGLQSYIDAKKYFGDI